MRVSAWARKPIAPSRRNPILSRLGSPSWTVRAARAAPRRGRRGENAVPCGPRLPYAGTCLRHGGASGPRIDAFRAPCPCLSASSGHARLVHAPVVRLCFDAVPCRPRPLDRCEVWTDRFRVLLLVHRESLTVRIEVASSFEAEIVLEVGRGTRRTTAVLPRLACLQVQGMKRKKAAAAVPPSLTAQRAEQ